MLSLMASFFPRDVLDEIWDLIESVSEGVPTLSSMRAEQPIRFCKTRRKMNVKVSAVKPV